MRELGHARGAGRARAGVAARLQALEGADETLVDLVMRQRVRGRDEAAPGREAGVGSPFDLDFLGGGGAREGGWGGAVHGFVHGGVAHVVFGAGGHFARLRGGVGFYQAVVELRADVLGARGGGHEFVAVEAVGVGLVVTLVVGLVVVVAVS